MEFRDLNAQYQALKGGINESGSFMNMSNATLAWEALSKLDFWVDINMFHHPGTEMADIILPCQHWTELNNIRVSQGASGGIGLTRHRAAGGHQVRLRHQPPDLRGA